MLQDDEDLNLHSGNILSGDEGREDGTVGGRETVSLAEMESCLDHGSVFNRKLVAKVILETLRATIVQDDSNELERVFAMIRRLGDDPESSVRAELVEQVPHIAMYCHEEREKLGHLVPRFLLPLVVRYLTDINNQVRKTSQAALLVVLEQDLVAKGDVEEQVCPLLVRLTDTDAHDDFRTEAVALMSRMAPLLGRDVTERLFLDRFAILCNDAFFHVRKVCATNFGDFCAVVGPRVAKAKLLSKFFRLCEDELWGVRKACAEVFMSVSRAVPLKTRRQHLAALFVNLLQDESRWVRMAAFQSLGPFISTFSQEGNNEQIEEDDDGDGEDEEGETAGGRHEEAMDLNEDSASQAKFMHNLEADVSTEERRAQLYRTGEEQDSDAKDFNAFNYWREPIPEVALVDFGLEHDIGGDTTPAMTQKTPLEEGDVEMSSLDAALEELMAQVELGHTTSAPATGPKEIGDTDEPKLSVDQEPKGEEHEIAQSVDQRQSIPTDVTSETGAGAISPENPLPVPIITTEDADEAPTCSPFTSSVVSGRPPPLYGVAEVYDLNDRSSMAGAYYDSNRRKSDSSVSSSSGGLPPQLRNIRTPATQSIVPQPLMDHYLYMTDPFYLETVDAEITRHCAFSLPAVACTLGRQHWPVLRELYESLAADVQWKVRRTVAASIHEVGAILGQDLVEQDLVPVFDEFIKDLDEVRIGVLKHLGEFFRLLGEKEKRAYLPRLAEFLKLDNEQNWRFRLELAEQLRGIMPLFGPADIGTSIVPLALVLASDRVASVRLQARHLVSLIISQLSQDGSEEACKLRSQVINELVQKLCQGVRWVCRQTYVNICGQLLADQVVPDPVFEQELLKPLLSLRWDRVANVRLNLAKVLSEQLERNEYYQTCDSAETIQSSIAQLRADEDRDVRFFSGGNPNPMSSQTKPIVNDECGFNPDIPHMETVEEY